MRSLVQIRSWVTEHPSKGFSNQRLYLEFQASTLSIAACPGQVKNEVGEVKIVRHLPSWASENILDLLSEFLVCHFVL